jgi:hypothetical protein
MATRLLMSIPPPSRSPGAVSSTNTTLSIQNASTFWQSAEVFAQNVTVNATTGDYDVQNVTQVVMQSVPVTASLNETIGNVSVSLGVALNQYLEDAAINVTITQGATTATMQGFQLAATNASMNILDIAYTVQLANTEQINTNLTSNATQKPRAAVITMSVNHAWVHQFNNGTNNDGRDAIAIIRYPESGAPKVLATRFVPSKSDAILDWFEADSPEGLSIFGHRCRHLQILLCLPQSLWVQASWNSIQGASPSRASESVHWMPLP